eukprot:10078727-Ditylum_brightwellii.AAC.1
MSCGEDGDIAHTFYSWFDSDINQLKAFTNEDTMDVAAKSNVVFVKQNPKHTIVEQAAYTGKMFKVTKKLCNKLQAMNLPPPQICQSIFPTIRNLKRECNINLCIRKRKLLSDFLSCIPAIFLLSVQRKKIIKAYICNKILDAESRLWPDIMHMLKSMGYTLSDPEYWLALDNLNVFYLTMRDNGYINESLFDKLGFPPDMTEESKIVPCDYGISKEHCQRYKTLFNTVQSNLRKSCSEELQ